ncbi:MAG: YifB family Mg chelatase-like AAA ATPase [Patescibacteria group bacterium]
MAIKLNSASLQGLEALLVKVEADIHPGLPKFFIVGLPDTAVQEARERVRTAIANSGWRFPDTRITVNLAPADMKKEGTQFDLPIALGIVAARHNIDLTIAKNSVIIGELSLDGAVRSVPGVLSVALMARKEGLTTLFVPAGNAKEAALIAGLKIIPIESLQQLIDHLSGDVTISATPLQSLDIHCSAGEVDLANVRGQHYAKRALEITAAGGHNLRMIGPPGSGKTLLSAALVSILPPPTIDEALEITRIYSVAGQLAGQKAIKTVRPFRHPHHSASPASLLGGGSNPKPGEISLAHRGVLFLDEFPEFPRVVIESLRQPLENGIISVARVANTLIFPARFILVAAHNPCPCGWLDDKNRQCNCTPYQIIRYQKKLSGPILDRIDLNITVPTVPFNELTGTVKAESSARVRERIIAARKIQEKRYVGQPIQTNAEMSLKMIEKYCVINSEIKELLKKALRELNLSARGFHRLLKVSRTIADLASQDEITIAHVSEALQYRQ